MTRRSRILLAGLAWLSVTAPVAPQPSPKSNIDEFFDRYVKDRSRQSPYTSTWTQVLPPKEQEKLDTELDPETEASTTDYFRYTREALSELRKFERSRMTPVQRVTARALEWDLDNILRSEPFRDYGYVFEQHFGIQLGVVQFLSSTHPIRNEQDARNYLARLRQVAVRFDEGIVVAREREKKKIVPPREILSATIEQIKRFIAPEPAANLLVTSLDERLAKVSGVPAAARADFVHTAEGIVKESVYPAYRRVMALLESQIPGSTDDAGWWRFPNGDKAYAQKLRSSTTTSLTADEIHQLGLREVARIEKEIDRVLRQLGYTAGTLEERLAAAQRKLPVIEGPDAAPKALARYEEIVRDAYKRSEALFDIVPKAKVEIVRIPEFREATNATAY